MVACNTCEHFRSGCGLAGPHCWCVHPTNLVYKFNPIAGKDEFEKTKLSLQNKNSGGECQHWEQAHKRGVLEKIGEFFNL